jgi:opacity protein-like surface antigen
MKKLLLLSALVYSLVGYSQFGIKAHYASYDLKVSGDGDSYSTTIDGFGIGADYGIEMGGLNLMLGLDFDFIKDSEDGYTSNATIFTPSAIARVPLGDTFGLRGGLSLVSWSSDDLDFDGIKKSMLHLPLGLDINLSDNLSVIAQYSLALGDRIKDNSDGDYKLTDPNFKVGLRYGL